MWSCFDIGVMNWKKSTELWSSCMAQGVWCREAQVDKENIDSTTKQPKSKTSLTILFWLMPIHPGPLGDSRGILHQSEVVDSCRYSLGRRWNSICLVSWTIKLQQRKHMNVVVVSELSVPGPEHCKTALTTQKKGYHGIPRKLEFVYVASVFPERCKGAEADSFEVWCLFPPEQKLVVHMFLHGRCAPNGLKAFHASMMTYIFLAV